MFYFYLIIDRAMFVSTSIFNVFTGLSLFLVFYSVELDSDCIIELKYLFFISLLN